MRKRPAWNGLSQPPRLRAASPGLAVAPQLLIQGAARNSEPARRAIHRATAEVDHALDVSPHHLVERQHVIRRRLVLGEWDHVSTVWSTRLKAKVSDVKATCTIRKQECALQDIAQLTHVAGPRVRL